MARRTYKGRSPVSLRRLFPQASFVGCADIQVVDASDDSRRCLPQSLFAAIPGTNADGRDFIADAITNGAESLLVQQPVADAHVPQCVVPDVRRSYAEICAGIAHCPSRRLKCVGVTGTNGKTTVTWMLQSILNSANRQCGLIGTIQYHDGIESEPSTLTTPDSRTFNRWLQRMLWRDTGYAAVELSSHALNQQRVAGTRLEVGIVTNVTQDHFDYHGNYEQYRACKARISEYIDAEGLLALNADDAGCRWIRELTLGRCPIRTFGLETSADVRAEVIAESLRGTRFEIHSDDWSVEVEMPFIGRHNVSNALAAAVAAQHLGCGPDEIRMGLEALHTVPGRLEPIDAGQPFDVFVDYAHTDDALMRVLDGLRPLTHGRLICVFGAGGDRDRGKRERFAQAVQAADLKIITSDNPRSECPQQIIDDVLAGFTNIRQQDDVHIESDRRCAIELAVQQARPGDCVLIAGKGHETTQIVGDQCLEFDDRAVAREQLMRLSPLLQQKRA